MSIALSNYDTEVDVAVGEKYPVEGSAVAQSGDTVTIQTGGTFTLKDNAGATVTGFDAIALTGRDIDPLTAPRAWYVLDTSAISPLPPFVVGVVEFDAIGTLDGITVHIIVKTKINLLPAVRPVATYHYPFLSVRDNVRALIEDKDVTQAVWADEEIDAAVALNAQLDGSNNAYSAAATLLEAACVVAARIASITKRGLFGDTYQTVYAALRDTARTFRSLSLQATLPEVTPKSEIAAMAYPYVNTQQLDATTLSAGMSLASGLEDW